MKDANHFEASWREITDIIHKMKSAICDVKAAEHLLIRGSDKVVDGLEKINKVINKMANGEDKQ